MKNTKWTRVDKADVLGYECGNVLINDNGGGMGRAEGSGRWAIVVDGKWVKSVDTLPEAKTLAERLMGKI